ncbi:hypothetical protein FKW77_005362 [Venturia effusa]|uniref:Uncharacterized protein n=1 Tax=Venturia effusa TaxID=50376 RepID=A0A517LQ59_9PEZI|nr:hypothetical protein FKW77_005362 [Venturia effusa]
MDVQSLVKDNAGLCRRQVPTTMMGWACSDVTGLGLKHTKGVKPPVDDSTPFARRPPTKPHLSDLLCTQTYTTIWPFARSSYWTYARHNERTNSAQNNDDSWACPPTLTIHHLDSANVVALKRVERAPVSPSPTCLPLPFTRPPPFTRFNFQPSHHSDSSYQFRLKYGIECVSKQSPYHKADAVNALRDNLLLVIGQMDAVPLRCYSALTIAMDIGVLFGKPYRYIVALMLYSAYFYFILCV